MEKERFSVMIDPLYHMLAASELVLQSSPSCGETAGGIAFETKSYSLLTRFPEITTMVCNSVNLQGNFKITSLWS